MVTWPLVLRTSQGGPGLILGAGGGGSLPSTVAQTAPTTLQTSVTTQEGITFNFDRAMPVGDMLNGRKFVVSSEAFNITSITPAYSASTGNGTMKDPYFTNDGPQGFDPWAANKVTTSVDVPYSSAVNIDPGNTGSSIAIAQGEETSIVKSLRYSGAGTNTWELIEDYVPLSVLATAPPVNSFCPGRSGTTKTVWSEADVNFNVLRSVAINSVSQTPAQALASFPATHGWFGNGGEGGRRMYLDAAFGDVPGNPDYAISNYSRDLTKQYAKAGIVLHSNAYTQAEKKDLFYRFIEWGIHIDSLFQRGWNGQGGYGDGAGQIWGYHWPLWLAAFALGSTAMLSRIQSMASPMDQAYWMTAARVTNGIGENNDSRGVPFLPEHIGVPFNQPETDFGANFQTRYGTIAATSHMYECSPIILLQNGPSGETAFTARNQGSYGTGNDKSAIWAFLDRAVTITPYPDTSNDPGSTGRNMWADVQAVGIYTPWTGPPDGLYQGSASYAEGGNGDFFTVSSNGFTWNFTGYNFATETKTGRAFRYSLDGTQWITDETVSDNDSVTGLLPNTTHYLAFRWQSASGWGPWVPNYRTIANSITPNVLTTGGTVSASVPSFTTAPIITTIQRPFFGDVGGNWIPASASLGANDVELKAGVGYVNGGAPPSFSFQWKRNGSNISGATSATYTRTVDDAGADLSCQVTPSNAAGTGTSSTTAVVTAPALTTLPSTTLINTDFRGAFAVDYATEWAAVTTNSANKEHLPAGTANGAEGLNYGLIRAVKTANNPSLDLPMQNLAVAGRTYAVDLQAVTTWLYGNTADGFFGELQVSIVNGSGTTIDGMYFAVDPPSATTPYVLDISDTFTAPNSEQLYIRIRNATGVFGAGYGSPGLSYAWVREM